MYAEAKLEPDKPNLHRLLRVFNYTLPLPAFENIIQELNLEGVYKELKGGISRKNFKNEQLKAMGDMLSNEWFERSG